MARITWEPGDFGDERVSITIDGMRDLLSYSRNSAERLAGIFGQEQEIAEWAEREGYQIVGRARDLKVHSQSQVDDRRGLVAVVEAIERCEAAGIVVERLDRLARDWYIQDGAVKRIWSAEGRVFSTDHGEWLPDRPGDSQWWQRKKYAEIAEAEYHALLARLEGGRKRKMARGGYGGGFRLGRRFGDELVEIQGKLEYRPIPAEREIIRRMRAAHADGRSYYGIAKDLNAEGVPTVKGAPWSTKVVRSIVLRPVYRLAAVPDVGPATEEPLTWLRETRSAWNNTEKLERWLEPRVEIRAYKAAMKELAKPLEKRAAELGSLGPDGARLVGVGRDGQVRFSSRNGYQLFARSDLEDPRES